MSKLRKSLLTTLFISGQKLESLASSRARSSRLKPTANMLVEVPPEKRKILRGNPKDDPASTIKFLDFIGRKLAELPDFGGNYLRMAKHIQAEGLSPKGSIHPGKLVRGSANFANMHFRIGKIVNTIVKKAPTSKIIAETKKMNSIMKDTLIVKLSDSDRHKIKFLREKIPGLKVAVFEEYLSDGKTSFKVIDQDKTLVTNPSLAKNYKKWCRAFQKLDKTKGHEILIKSLRKSIRVIDKCCMSKPKK